MATRHTGPSLTGSDKPVAQADLTRPRHDSKRYRENDFSKAVFLVVQHRIDSTPTKSINRKGASRPVDSYERSSVHICVGVLPLNVRECHEAEEGKTLDATRSLQASELWLTSVDGASAPKTPAHRRRLVCLALAPHIGVPEMTVLSSGSCPAMRGPAQRPMRPNCSHIPSDRRTPPVRQLPGSPLQLALSGSGPNRLTRHRSKP